MGEYFFKDSYKIVIYFEEVLCIWVRKIKKTKITIITIIQIIKITTMKDKIIITDSLKRGNQNYVLFVSFIFIRYLVLFRFMYTSGTVFINYLLLGSIRYLRIYNIIFWASFTQTLTTWVPWTSLKKLNNKF